MKRRRSPKRRRETRASGIDRERVLGVLRRRPGRGWAPAEIARALELRGGARRALSQVLEKLVAEGAVDRSAGRYRVPRVDGLVEATVSAGGCIDDRGRGWRIHGERLARSGDRVLLAPLGPDFGADRAEMLQVLVGPRETWVGIFARQGAEGVVTPYRDDFEWSVRIAPRDRGGARAGQVVEVAPVGPAGATGRDARPRGRVMRVLGRPGDPDADVRAVVWRRRLPDTFPPAALEQAEALPDALDPAEVARRVDLRDLPFVTIDPATARDHDDAVCTAPTNDGRTRLWVAIADVSHYVPAGSPIDREARRRGNSVYFPDRALPMLPERLSGGLCSLREGVDRLAFAVELEVDGSGRVHRPAFYPAVIRSRARLVYEDAAAACAGEGGPAAAFREELSRLVDVARALGRRRRQQGTIDFELPEVEVLFGSDGRPASLATRARTSAHRAVEEAMLAANRAVAEALVNAGASTVFRNHEKPLPRDLEELVELFDSYGLHLPPVLGPKEIAAALEAVAGRPGEAAFNRAVLRSMRQARYEARSRGHFALGFTHYLHFTSPIRRYADLQVHRALAATLDEHAPGASLDLAGLAARLSWCERRAVEAERECVDLATCAVMARHLGEEFDGTVTGVARHGLYVTLDEPPAEGLVHVSRLPGFYTFDERHQTLVARRSGRRFRLGDRLRVRVDAVDPVLARVDYALAGERGRRS